MGSLVLVSPQMLVHKNKDGVTEGKKRQCTSTFQQQRLINTVQFRSINTIHITMVELPSNVNGWVGVWEELPIILGLLSGLGVFLVQVDTG